MQQGYDNETKENVRKILLALTGEGSLDRNDKGMIGKVSNIDNRLKKVEDFKKKSLWTATLLVGVVTVIWAIITFVFK